MFTSKPLYKLFLLIRPQDGVSTLYYCYKHDLLYLLSTKSLFFQLSANFGALNVTSVQDTQDYKQFSREPIMSNFGDLNRGEIPEPLKYNRQFCKYPPLF